MKTLAEYRSSLDRIDATLVSILAERFRITDEVAVFKKEHDIAPTDAQREKRQFERIRELAATHGLEPEIAEAVLRLVIDKAVERHRIVQGSG